MIQRSHIHGYGLYARNNIVANEMIVEYIGEKVRQGVADKREIDYEQRGFGSCYLFRLDGSDIVDATCIGGMARFMNHCCEPNAYAQVIETNRSPAGALFENTSLCSPVKREKHIVIMALRNIHAGEEVTYDYKFAIEEVKISCFCGASKCKGAMN